uniref:Uncharacterized protein n=1 Tax=Trichuris muris TaxID=70415 RepID=A0A5S6QDP8_TRIMR
MDQRLRRTALWTTSPGSERALQLVQRQLGPQPQIGPKSQRAKLGGVRAKLAHAGWSNVDRKLERKIARSGIPPPSPPPPRRPSATVPFGKSVARLRRAKLRCFFIVAATRRPTKLAPPHSKASVGASVFGRRER